MIPADEIWTKAVAELASNKPETAIAETGWPTGSDWANTSSNGGGAEASTANLQTFIDTFVCQANANGTHYFFCKTAVPVQRSILIVRSSSLAISSAI